jgi:hypothetical protein
MGVASTTITSSILRLASAPSRLSASLRPRTGLTALTGHSVEPCLGFYVMVGPLYGSFRSERRRRRPAACTAPRRARRNPEEPNDWER